MPHMLEALKEALLTGVVGTVGAVTAIFVLNLIRGT